MYIYVLYYVCDVNYNPQAMVLRESHAHAHAHALPPHTLHTRAAGGGDGGLPTLLYPPHPHVRCRMSPPGTGRVGCRVGHRRYTHAHGTAYGALCALCTVRAVALAFLN